MSTTRIKYAFIRSTYPLVIYELEYLDEDVKDLSKRFKWQRYNLLLKEHRLLEFESRIGTVRIFKDGSSIDIHSPHSATYQDCIGMIHSCHTWIHKVPMVESTLSPKECTPSSVHSPSLKKAHKNQEKCLDWVKKSKSFAE